MPVDDQNDQKGAQMNPDSPCAISASVPSSNIVLGSPQSFNSEEADAKRSSQPYVHRTFSEGEVPVAEEEVVIEYVAESPASVASPPPVPSPGQQQRPRAKVAKSASVASAASAPTAESVAKIHFEIHGDQVKNLSSEQLWTQLSMEEVSTLYGIMHKLTKAAIPEIDTRCTNGAVNGDDWRDHLDKEGSCIPVKKLRNIIPRMLMAAYHQEEDRQGKRKLKRLWEDKPGDWPVRVPFVDPNNGEKSQDGKSRTKPKQQDLVQMFNHLRSKLNGRTRPYRDGDEKPVVTSSTNPSSEFDWFGKGCVDRIQLKTKIATRTLNERGKHTQCSILAYMEDILKTLDQKAEKDPKMGLKVQNACLEVESILEALILNTHSYSDSFLTSKLNEFTAKYLPTSMEADEDMDTEVTNTKYLKREYGPGAYRVQMEYPTPDLSNTVPLLNLKQEPMSPHGLHTTYGIKLANSDDMIGDDIIQSIFGSQIIESRPLVPSEEDLDNAYKVPKDLDKLFPDITFADLNGGNVIVEPANPEEMIMVNGMIVDKTKGFNIEDIPMCNSFNLSQVPTNEPCTNIQTEGAMQTEGDLLSMVDGMMNDYMCITNTPAPPPSCQQKVNAVLPVQQSTAVQEMGIEPQLQPQQQEQSQPQPQQQEQSQPQPQPPVQDMKPVDRTSLMSLLGALNNSGVTMQNDVLQQILKDAGIPTAAAGMQMGGVNTAYAPASSVTQTLDCAQTNGINSSSPFTVSITPTTTPATMSYDATPQLVLPLNFFNPVSTFSTGVPTNTPALFANSNFTRDATSPTTSEIMKMIPTMVENMVVTGSDTVHSDDDMQPPPQKRMRTYSKGKKGRQNPM